MHKLHSGTEPTLKTQDFPGGCIEGATSVPIPNTEVKPFGADGTAWVTVWESRTLPGLITKARRIHAGGLFAFIQTSGCSSGQPAQPTGQESSKLTRQQL